MTVDTMPQEKTINRRVKPAASKQPRAGSGYGAAILALLLRLGVLFGAGLLWEALARIFSSPFIPPLSAILANAWEQWVITDDGLIRLSPDLLTMFSASFARLIPGLAWGILAGITLGILVARVQWISELCMPLFQFLRAIPSSAKIPLFMAVLGIGDAMKIWVIAIAVALPLLMNAADGARNIDPTLLAMSEVYKVGTWQRLTRIVLPAASPQIFAGLRIATTISLIVLVVTELTGASSGVGHFVNYAQTQFLVLDMWAGVLLLGAIGYLLNVVLSFAEKRVLRWQHESTATTS